ncbi:D-tyrosyl-tRNA(Tyr) deacylase [Candidatus Sumerlaeota bacterium]|nr:D-tyrosyl-tRNA(Tyr) deacylase [Candidatus Sumerlaeota bacterium]
MRILVQRVSRAAVHVEDRAVGVIGRGLLLLVGIGREDDETVLAPMAEKVVNLRIFPDPVGPSHFDRSALDEKADLLVVSQFTLHADSRKGRRPSFSAAAEPVRAQSLLDSFVALLRRFPLRVETGVFGAMMDVSLNNDGPVSLWLDSEELLAGRRRTR